MRLGDGLAVHVAGDPGERVLWFHGYTMDSSVFAELWDRLPGFTHVGVDLPGHGRSRPVAPGDTLAALAAEVAAGAEREGIRHLVGLSFGTLLALQVAATRPAAFASLVLAAPALAGAPHDPDVERRYVDLALLYRRAGPGPHLRELWMRDPPDLFRHVNRRPALAARLAAVIDRHGWTELGGTGMRGFTEPAQDDALVARVRASTLIVLGEDELPAHRSCAARIARTVPSCEVAMVAGAGHLVLLEEPDVVAPVVAEHVAAASVSR